MLVNPTVKPVNTVQYLAWGDQRFGELLAWHKANPGIQPSPEAFKGYEAGFKAAWIEALVTLRLQGMVVSDGK